MKIRSNIRAGDALADCQKQRDYWKAQATYMEKVATSTTPKPPSPLPPTPPTTSVSCGWVNGVYYGDKSGTCG